MSRKGDVPAEPTRIGRTLILAAAWLLSVNAAAAADTYDRIGEASWYGERYQGRRTASGAPFDMNALTAAHRHLAFGTLVRVTNLDNQRAVFVRITDRGPYARGRLIDLSRRAAELLGFAGDGVARVQVRVERESASPVGGQTSSYLIPVSLRPPPDRFPWGE